MMKKNYYCLSIGTIVMFFSMLFTSAYATNEVVQLVCEYHMNPLGIDVQKPRLSWQIRSAGENLLQTAYEIRVADSPAHLFRKNKQIWTSGKVESAKSVNVIYEEPTLKSMQRVYWQIRIWG